MIIASICYIYDVLIYRVIRKTMLNFMLLDKNHEMSLVGCGLAMELFRRDLVRVRACISQRSLGQGPNNSQGEAALIFTCGYQVVVEAGRAFAGGSISLR